MANTLRSFPHLAMIITGVMHAILGIVIFIVACVGLGKKITFYDYTIRINGILYTTQTVHNLIRGYLGGGMLASFWIMMVGVLGILTGIKREKYQVTNGLKIGYMVTAILSAVIFSWLALVTSSLVYAFYNYEAIAIVGSLCGFAEFVLAIVSSSICCCCAKSTPEPDPGVVFVQNQGPAPGTYSTGNYPPGSYPPGSYPPTSYPANANLAGAQ